MGTTEIDSPSTMMFTVTNMGGKVLNLGESISLPDGFSLAAGFGTTTLDTFESTTFVVQMDAVDWGLYGGTVSFTNDDADENPFSFEHRGDCHARAVYCDRRQRRSAVQHARRMDSLDHARIPERCP